MDILTIEVSQFVLQKRMIFLQLNSNSKAIHVILTGVELNDGLGRVRVRVGDGGQLRVLIYRIVNLKQEEN